MTPHIRKSSRIVKKTIPRSKKNSDYREFTKLSGKDYMVISSLFILGLLVAVQIVTSINHEEKIQNFEKFTDSTRSTISQLESTLDQQNSKLNFIYNNYKKLSKDQESLMENINLMEIIYKNKDTSELVNVLSVEEAYRSRITKNSRYEPHKFKF